MFLLLQATVCLIFQSMLLLRLIPLLNLSVGILESVLWKRRTEAVAFSLFSIVGEHDLLFARNQRQKEC